MLFRSVLLNLISFVANRLAYDAAMAIASGGKGQSPNYEYRSVEEYGQDLFEDVLGETIGSLSGTLGEIGIDFDICAPTDPTKRLNLQLGIARMSGSGSARPEPKCEFRSITSNWEGFIASSADNLNPDKIFKDFATQFTSGGTDLSASIIAIETAINKAAGEKAVKTDELLANDRFKDVSDVITGNVETPSTVLEDQFKSKLNKQQDNQSQALQDSLFGNEGALLQVGVSAGSVFLNTLLSELTNKIYNGLFEPPTTGGVFNPEFIDVGGRDTARDQFKGLLAAPISSIPNYDVVTQEFIACPGASQRGPNNCVMGADFATLMSYSAAGDTMTVQEAIDAELLHGEWSLIDSEDTARNEDPFCYTYGYCHANLVKMRIARIIPVGWELAALKAKQVTGPTDLQTIVNGFDDCNEDNPDAPISASNPWCHLIDPNWVIKHPETQCRANVTGATLLAENADTRHETCVDTPSCIEEDENGKCIGGFGYCTRERNSWRFDGDSCPAEFASCLTLTSRTGVKDSLLTTTVDYASCDADNVGCTWYNTVKELNDADTAADPTDDQFVFDTILDLFDDGNPTATVADENSRQYFNASVATCGDGDDGCTELVRAADSALNPVRNPSFEQDSDQDGVPDFWTLDGNASYLQNFSSSAIYGGSTFQVGSDVVELDAGGEAITRDPIHLYPNQFVTVSFTAIAGPTLSSGIELRLEFADEEGFSLNASSTLPMPAPAVTSDCTDEGAWLELNESSVPDDALTRYGCTFSTPEEDVWMSIIIEGLVDTIYLDAIQVDEAEVTTDFHSGYAKKDTTNIKLAPDYLGCTGDPSDNALCANYAQICTAAEIGCTAYTPTNGNPTVPGIVNSNDYCPSECVGYETYRQLETNFAAPVFPVYLIADTAQSCPAQYNGCAEFTNLDALAEGGERLQYFTDVRVCQEVVEAAATNTPGEVYYTWEGSDNEGFQLITWTLKGTDSTNGGPCQNFNATSGACEDATSTYLPIADCQAHADIFTNPDCREFYDTSGDIFFRLFSDTVTVSNECSPFRKTVSNVTDCAASNGVWNAASGNCSYNILPAESLSCAATNNGCRGYVGNTGNNTRVAFSEFFEEGTILDWSATTLDTPSAVDASIYYSNESVATGGHSFQIPSAAYAIPTDGQIQPGFEYLISFWAKGSGDFTIALTDGTNEAAFATAVSPTLGWQEYTLGPLNPALVNAAINVEDSYLSLSNVTPLATPVFIDNIVMREVQDTVFLIENSWITPSTCDQTASGAPAPQFNLGCTEYSTHRGDQVDLKSFTSICREAAIGCEGFYDTKNSSSEHAQAYNLTCGDPTAATVTALTSCSFNNEEVCTILIGQNTCKFNYMGVDQPNVLASFVNDDSEIVNRDEKTFIVDRPDVHCSADVAGCTEFGMPSFNLDKTEVVSFESVWLVDRPDDYVDTLCHENDLFCEAFATEDGSQYYFKNPGPQKCEWKAEVLISGVGYYGWFRTGTDEPCYYTPVLDDDIFDPTTELASAYLIGGLELGAWRNGDAGYDGWVAQCPAKWNECSEFIDVADNTDGLYPEGKPYTFLKNEKLDEADLPANEKCNGLISQEAGCVAFNDTSIASVDFSSSASYLKSRYAHRIQELNRSQFAPITPVSCPYGGEVTVDGNVIDLCASRCAYSLVTGMSGSDTVEELFVGGSCYINSDCGTIDDVFSNPTNGTCVNFDDNTVSDPLAVIPAGICVGGELSGDACTPGDPCGTGVCEDISESTVLEINSDGGPITDDSNTILKVRRDRSCSEWLACDAGFTAYDERQGKNVQVCNSVALCNEFSVSGDNTFCSNWTEQPLEVLDEIEYASRDVTWYGSEYSGYSIPNQYPIEKYTQVDLNPGRWCISPAEEVLNPTGIGTEFDTATGTWSQGSPGGCSNDAGCGLIVTGATCELAPDDFRLGVSVGPCLGEALNGTQCVVGFCEDSGLACAEDDQCAVSTPGACNTITTANKIGVCYNGGCVQNIEGENFNSENAYAQECRGYPEESAPFPRDIVTQEQLSSVATDRAAAVTSAWETRALTRKQGYNHAKLCANGEDCECSYKKAYYGDGVKTLYFGPNTTTPSGICSGGKWDGLACGADWQCAQQITGHRATSTDNARPERGVGTCTFKTTENTYVGWDGLCVQHDGSIRKNGSSDSKDEACLLWLPVDQLTGGTDIYNKFTEAGFSISNASHCTDTSLFVDVYVNGAQINDDGEVVGIDYACAESLGGGARMPVFPSGFFDPFSFFIGAAITDQSQFTTPTSETGGTGADCLIEQWDSCWNNVVCPKNSYAIVGACLPDVICGDGNDIDRDCPYMCIPIGSRAIAAEGELSKGEVCEPPAHLHEVDIHWSLELDETVIGTYPEADVEVDPQIGYLVNDIQTVEYYKQCALKGVEFTPYDSNLLVVDPIGDLNEANQYYLPVYPTESMMLDAYQNTVQFYLGCSEVAYTSVEPGYGVDDSAFGNKAWTNRVLTPGDPYTLSAAPWFDTNTAPQEVGKVQLPLEFDPDSSQRLIDIAQFDKTPAIVSSCLFGTTLSTKNGASTCAQFPPSSPSEAGSYSPTSVTLPIIPPSYGGGGCDLNIDDDDDDGDPVNLDSQCNEGSTSCDKSPNAADSYACFIECSAYAMANNPAAAEFTDPNAWCASLVPAEVTSVCELAQSLSPDPLDCGGNSADYGCQAPTYICSAYYGYGGDENALLGDKGDDADSACYGALQDGIIPPMESGSSYAYPWSNFAEPWHQCDGAGGQNHMCKIDADCPGYQPAATCEEFAVTIDEDDGNVQGFCSVTYSTEITHIVPMGITNAGSGAGLTMLNQFFGKVYSIWQWDGDEPANEFDSTSPSGAYTLPSTAFEPEDFDVTDAVPVAAGDSFGSGPNSGTPDAPEIRGLGTTCVNDNCSEGPLNTITVNGSFNQAYSSQNSFLADLRFFATTDPNHFPLRNVIVDWGDGMDTAWDTSGENASLVWGRGSETGSTSLNNYYKARRGLDASDLTNITPICSAETEWGMTGESCEDGPFQFVHHYRCTPGMQNWLQVTGRACDYEEGTNRLLNSPCWAGECVFQPRVHVVDNWGYCSGVCGDTDDDGFADGICEDTSSQGGCAYASWPEARSNPQDIPAVPNPWVNYGGEIHVSP